MPKVTVTRQEIKQLNEILSLLERIEHINKNTQRDITFSNLSNDKLTLSLYPGGPFDGIVEIYKDSLKQAHELAIRRLKKMAGIEDE